MFVGCVILGNWDSASVTADNSVYRPTGEVQYITASATVNYADIHSTEDVEIKYPPTPWKRLYAAYVPQGRASAPSWRGRRLIAQQRPRDGLHAIN